MPTPLLFQPITFRSVTARNRMVVAPMCQYSATDGLGDDWHVQHLGARAAGGAGIVFAEASHVSVVGRIAPPCLGVWAAQHQALLGRLAAIIRCGGAVPGIQLAHAGRKASTTRTCPAQPDPLPFGRRRSARAERWRDRRDCWIVCQRGPATRCRSPTASAAMQASPPALLA